MLMYSGLWYCLLNDISLYLSTSPTTLYLGQCAYSSTQYHLHHCTLPRTFHLSQCTNSGTQHFASLYFIQYFISSTVRLPWYPARCTTALQLELFIQHSAPTVVLSTLHLSASSSTFYVVECTYSGTQHLPIYISSSPST
jgi:hypothetical protein